MHEFPPAVSGGTGGPEGLPQRADLHAEGDLGTKRNISGIVGELDAIASITPSGTETRFEKLEAPGTYAILGPRRGATVMILGGVHGNEPAGVLAAKSIMTAVAQGDLEMLRGRAIIAIGNPEAVDQNRRAVERNLNRCFVEDEKMGNSQEDGRARELKPLIHKSIALLDLHSTTRPTEPFVWIEKGRASQAESLGIPWIICYDHKKVVDTLRGTSEIYTYHHGMCGLTVENGRHQDPSTTTHALSVATRFLENYGLIGQEALALFDRSQFTVEPKFLEAFALWTKISEDFRFVREFNNLDLLPKGTDVAVSRGNIHRTREDCRIVLPTPPEIQKVGEEVCLFARELKH